MLFIDHNFIFKLIFNALYMYSNYLSIIKCLTLTGTCASIYQPVLVYTTVLIKKWLSPLNLMIKGGLVGLQDLDLCMVNLSSWKGLRAQHSKALLTLVWKDKQVCKHTNIHTYMYTLFGKQFSKPGLRPQLAKGQLWAHAWFKNVLKLEYQLQQSY